jgi:dihydrodipicolinate synthase/N-acetylneuraminate lyase
MTSNLEGIFAASVTPFDDDGIPALHLLSSHLRYLEANGCHGALILGTTGEGPSLGLEERISILEAAAAERGDLLLIAGTGAASLADAITLTRKAFDLGYDGVVVVPPFYFKSATLEGLYLFYAELINQAVPEDGNLLAYHIPQISGVPVEGELIRRLRDTFPTQMVGIKDSSGSVENMKMLCSDEFEGFWVFTGNDTLLSDTLAEGGAGAITALANVFPRRLREVFDAHQENLPIDHAQARLTSLRENAASIGPSLASVMKALLRLKGLLPNDYVRPPLRRLDEAEEAELKNQFDL